MMHTFLDFLAVWGIRLAAVLFAPLLLLFARTWRGRAVGVLFGSAMLIGMCWAVVELTARYVLTIPPRPVPPFGCPIWLAEVAFVVAVFLAMFQLLWVALASAYLLLSLPAYRSDTSGVRSVFLGPTFLHRWQMAILDEQDWLWLGVQLGTRLDFRISRQEAPLIRERVRNLLDELKEIPDARDIPPALPLAVWGKVFRPDHGHLLVYRPTSEAGERLALLVFLHGHGGSTLLFPHLLREFADAHRLVLVCPSFGYGNWEHPESPRCVQRAVDYALEHFGEIDPKRVFLAGLSQGGAGVGRAAAAMPDTFAGLIFLAATMEPKVLENEAFAGKRVLVTQGDADRHVTLKSVLAGVEALNRAGADVTTHRDPTGTHFLFFSQTDEVLRLVGEWVREGRAAHRGGPYEEGLSS